MDSLPRRQSKPTKAPDGAQASPFSAEVLEREADELGRQSHKRRAWSRVGALEVTAWSKVYFTEIAPGVRTNHRHYHRRKWRAECGTLCEAKEILAVILLGFESAPNRTALPLLAIIVPSIEKLCRVPIRKPLTLYQEVRRDLRRLRSVLVVPTARRIAADRSLIRRYPETAALIQHHAAGESAPANRPA